MQNHLSKPTRGRVFLARHATPDRTRPDLPYHLPPGPPLTTQGQGEAGELGAFFQRQAVRFIYCSPLERCQHTAQIAAQRCGAAVRTLDQLIEWQPGEATPVVQERIWPIFTRAFQESQQSGPVALVTHGGPIGALLLLLGLNEAELDAWRVYDHRNPLPTAGAWQITQNAARAWVPELVFQPAAGNSNPLPVSIPGNYL